jgi:exopolyphosphatase/guanosine-5'-triphosphate,3'-diphosphate pyrophosphatase
MSPRRSAFFDIGTNTVLCLIAEIRDTGRFRVLDDLAEITRLGEGVDQTRRISPAGQERTLATLQHYRARCNDLGVDQFFAVGTSALRDAENSPAVRERFRSELGFDVRVISGAEEAGYSFLAVQRGLSLADQPLLVIDIGGGSTELIAGDRAGISDCISIDLGSVRLTERFLSSDPVTAGEVARMTAAIDEELARLDRRWRAAAPRSLVGIAATVTTLMAMEKKLVRYAHAEVHGATLPIGAVRRQIAILQSASLAQRRCIPGLDPGRADVIFAGACILERIMSHARADHVVVSDQGVRYGLLHEAAAQLKG